MRGMRLLILLSLLSLPAAADTKANLGDRTMGLTFDAELDRPLKKCKHGHDAVPVTVTFAWADGRSNQQVEVCPICYRKMLEKAAGY